MQTDRFSGGLRLNVQQVFGLGTARCRYARCALDRQGDKLPTSRCVARVPAKVIEAPQPDLPNTRQGLPVRVVVERRTAEVAARGGGLDLGESLMLFPE